MGAGWAATFDDLAERVLAADQPTDESVNACLDHAEAVDPADTSAVWHCCYQMLRVAAHLGQLYSMEMIEPVILVAMNAALAAYATTADTSTVRAFASELSRWGLTNHAVDLLGRALRWEDPAAHRGLPPPAARLLGLQGELLRRLQALDAAEQALATALAELEGSEPEVERLRAEVLNNLGLIHHDRGDLEGAKRYLIEAFEMSERAGRTPVETAVVLDNLGTVEAAIAAETGPLWLDKDYVNAFVDQHLRDAEHYHERAAELFETALPEAAEDYVISLLNQVYVAGQLGHRDREDALSLRVLEILDQGPISRSTVMFAVAMRGQVLSRAGRHREVIELLRPWLYEWADAAAQDRPMPGLAALMSAAALEGDHELAATVGVGIVSTDDDLMEQRMAGASERAARDIFGEYAQHTELVIGHCLPADPAGVAPDWLYELLLNRKGVLAERQGSAWLKARDAVGDLLDTVRALRAEVARCDLDWSGEATVTEARRRQDEAVRRLSAAEAELYRELGGEWLPTVTLQDVRSRLPEQTTLLDLTMVRMPSGERTYVLFLVPPRGDVRYRNLGTVREVNDRIRATVAEFAKPPAKGDAREWKLLLRELAPALVGPADSLTRELLLAPTGLWGRLPVCFLPDADGRPLVDNHVLELVPSGRSLASSAAATVGEPPGPPLVLGAPDFDLGYTDDETFFFSMRLPALEHASTELTAVADQFAVTPVLGAEATRARLLAARRPRILHIATHGIFLDALGSIAERSEPVTYSLRNIGGAAVRIDNPELGFERKDKAFDARTRHRARVRWLREIGPADQLSRSALLLGGFNAWLAGVETAPEVGAGIVSAAEFAALDMTGTELVVLSACETGVGAVDYADGSLVGLRTAALAAGAQYCVSTLWKVDDASTATLMAAFYRELSNGLPPPAALRAAQLTTQRVYPAPYHWAGWVVEGHG